MQYYRQKKTCKKKVNVIYYNLRNFNYSYLTKKKKNKNKKKVTEPELLSAIIHSQIL